MGGTLAWRTTTADGVLTVSNAPFARVAYNVVPTTDVVSVTGPGVGRHSADAGRVDCAPRPAALRRMR